MAQSVKNKSKRKSPLPLIFMGAGLIFLSVAILIFVPKENVPAKSESRFSAVPAAVNYPVPELTLTDINSYQVSLADLRGQVILVNNWATWCPPCRAEMPELEAYFRAHKNDDFVLVGINSGDKQAQVVDFVAEYGLTFPMWLDYDGEALYAFGTNALPSSFVIDKTGTVRLAWSGGIDTATLEEYVTPILKE